VLAATSVQYAIEHLSDGLWQELHPLLEAHWHEVAHYDDIALNPHLDAYERIEKSGCLRIYTARAAAPAPDRGRLIGYLAVFVQPSLHYADRMFANQDVLFVDPLHRGSRCGVDLIRFAHDKLKAEGVSVLFQHVKARSDLNVGPMLERLLGYELVDQIYAVRLDREKG